MIIEFWRQHQSINQQINDNYGTKTVPFLEQRKLYRFATPKSQNAVDVYILIIAP